MHIILLLYLVFSKYTFVERGIQMDNIFVKHIQFLRYSLLLTDFLLFVYVLVTRFQGEFVYSLGLLLIATFIQLYTFYSFKKHGQTYIVQKIQKMISLVFVVGFSVLMLFAQSMSLNNIINIATLILSSCLVILYPAPNTYNSLES